MSLTAAQIEMRLSGLGSSDIGAIAGESPWKTAHSVWLEKRGLADPFDGNDATWLGNVLEPALGARYAEEFGVKVVPGPGTVRHPDHPWVLGTTDFEHADGSAILECKVVGWRVEHHWDDKTDDGMPSYVAAQTQWLMGVRGIQRCAVPVLFTSDSRFRVFLSRFDERIFNALLKIGDDFWRGRVLSGVPPETDGTEDARQVLLKLYPRNVRTFQPAPPGAYDQAIAYQEAKAAEKRAKGEAALAGNRLRSLIGDAEGIEGNWGKATWVSDRNGIRTLRVTVKEERAA